MINARKERYRVWRKTIRWTQHGVGYQKRLPEWDFPGGSMAKTPHSQCRGPGFDPWIGKILWRKAWQPTPVFLPEESHGQRSLAGYSPWGCKESDMTEGS